MEPLTWTAQTRSAQGTRALARAMAAQLPWGTVVALSGELGAGKTHFVQGLAEGLAVHDIKQVLSPTYTLVNEYAASGGVLVHIDFYRLHDAESALALGIEEQVLRRDAVVAIEWADHLPELLPKQVVWVKLSRTGATHRTCEVRGMARPDGL